MVSASGLSSTSLRAARSTALARPLQSSPAYLRLPLACSQTRASRVQIQLIHAIKKTSALTREAFFIGERVGIRTRDPLIKSQMLYQLSYAPNNINFEAVLRRRGDL